MLSNSLIKFNAVIDLAKYNLDGSLNPDYKKIILTDTTDYSGEDLENYKGFFIITDPNNTIIHSGNFTSPDITQDDALIFDAVEVPLDSLGKILNGNYKFQYFVTDGENEFSTPVITYKICDCDCDSKSSAKVCIEFNCDSGLATAIDKTQYSGNSTFERVLTLRPPLNSRYESGDLAEAYASPNNYVVSDALWSGSWEAHLVAVVTHTQTISDGFVFSTIEYVESYDNGEAACEVNLCGLYKCITSELDKIKKEANNRGGLSNNIDLQDKVEMIEMEYISMEVARSCGNRTKVVKHYKALKELLDCDCGCGSTGSPAIIKPVLPVSNNVAVEGSLPIVVVPTVVGNTTTYTVSLSSSFQSIINALKQVSIVSTDGSVGVSSSDSLPNVRTFNLSVDTDVVKEDLLDNINIACLGLTSPNNKFDDVFQEIVNRVCQPPAPPVARDDFKTTTEGTAVVIQQFINDFANSGVVTTITEEPLNGTAVIQDDGTILYTPDGGFTGVDVIEYTIEDIYGQTSTAEITIIVNAEPAESCNVITAAYVAQVNVTGTDVVVQISNQTNYNGNVPDTVKYYITVLDSDSNAIHTYLPVDGNSTPVPPTTFVLPDPIADNWHSIRIVMHVTSETASGDACGTVIYESDNALLVPDIGLSFYAGVDVSCLETDPDATDTEITQALVDKACGGGSAENGIVGTGTSVDKYKLGGSLIEDTEIDANGNDFEIVNSGLFSQRSGGASSIGTAAKRESIHEVQNFNASNGYAIHYDRTVSNIDTYTLTDGNAITNKSTSHLLVLKSNVTTSQLKSGSAVSNAIDAMQIDSSGGSYSLAQEQGSGTHTRRVLSNRRVQTILHPTGLSTKATIGKFANLEVICTAQAYNNTFSEFIQVFVRSAKGTGSVQASGTDMPSTYGIYQEDNEDKNYFASGIFMLPNLPVYADNAAATSGGLPTGALYRTSTGDLKVKY